jgi:hypothetical protein
MSAALLFPAGMPEALEQLRVLTAQGRRVIGASSLPNDPAQPLYPAWAFLPFITDPRFEDAFVALVKAQRVTNVFTRHPVIGRYLKALIAQHRLEIALDAATFAAATIEQHQSIFARVDALIAQPFALTLPNERPALSRLAMASLMCHALRIEGQSSDEKIVALMEIFRSCPRGDIVEIGSFWGRSACVLAVLAKHYAIGALLCLDPWRNDEAHQEGVPQHLNDEARDIDFDSAFQGFLINLLPYADGRINYTRGGAHDAHARYREGLSVTSEAFGTTTYTGRIACLHIDGNHDLAHITQDMADWIPHVVAGGWIIIDDYQWAFGDGPQIAADRWVEENLPDIACAFATGSALFIKRKG